MPALQASGAASLETLPLVADTMSGLDMLPHAPQPRRRRRGAATAQHAESKRHSESSESESESEHDEAPRRKHAPKTTSLASPSSSLVPAPSPVAGSVTTVTVTPSLTAVPTTSSTPLPLAPGTGSKQKPSEGQSEESPKKSQAGRISGGAEAGIVLGILGFLALVFITIILYRRFKRCRPSKGFKLSEKEPPPPPPPPKPHAQRSNSSIMDDAMQAVYAAEKQPKQDPSQPDFQTQGQPSSSRSTWLNRNHPAPPPSPSRSTWLTKQGEPSSSQSIAWLDKGKGRAVDHDMPLNPPANILRAQSLTPSEMTVATESTWRTWNVDQKQSTSRKKSKHTFLR
ncbi:hypothetical protein CDD81_4624 [Ophiocordyceps australis]|uniref:Uncharacterized protein n=1 Tax=Ophiocordyceps australis TaxID=1399860 RepID=A0A2C5Y9V5_9HYPO|nr:hypothetical protein CDD81_4624 [Ophiocordyceps australis]